VDWGRLNSWNDFLWICRLGMLLLMLFIILVVSSLLPFPFVSEKAIRCCWGDEMEVIVVLATKGVIRISQGEAYGDISLSMAI
jgi:Conserved region of Rad21 / Rec8 like protein